MNMKLMVTLVALAMTMLFQSSAIAQIRLQPPGTLPPSLNLDSTNLNLSSTNLYPGLSNHPQGKLFAPLHPSPQAPLPEIEMPPVKPLKPLENMENNIQSDRLPPGVYQTAPYAGIVMVPGPEHDDSSVLGPGTIRPSSNMPVIHPHIQIAPMRPGMPLRE